MNTRNLRRLYSHDGTVELLEYILRHEGCCRKDVLHLASRSTVDNRLKDFRELSLIEKGTSLRLTESGRTYLSIIKDVESLSEELG